MTEKRHTARYASSMCGDGLEVDMTDVQRQVVGEEVDGRVSGRGKDLIIRSAHSPSMGQKDRMRR